jgi:hypothetical protein
MVVISAKCCAAIQTHSTSLSSAIISSAIRHFFFKDVKLKKFVGFFTFLFIDKGEGMWGDEIKV